jgi:hypothetical protein
MGVACTQKVFEPRQCNAAAGVAAAASAAADVAAAGTTAARTLLHQYIHYTLLTSTMPLQLPLPLPLPPPPPPPLLLLLLAAHCFTNTFITPFSPPQCRPPLHQSFAAQSPGW